MSEGQFSDNLKLIRKERGLSQGDLAEKANLLPSAISHYETGRRTPSIGNIVRLSNALQIPADFLLGRDITLVNVGPKVKEILDVCQKLEPLDLDLLLRFARFLSSKD